MSGGYIDIILFALLAGVLIYRLYVTLGQNPRHESDQASGQFDQRSTDAAQGDPYQKYDKSRIRVNSEDSIKQGVHGLEADTLEKTPLDDVHPEHWALIHKVYPPFDYYHFMDGCLRAYDIIQKSFASGDTETLEKLLEGKAFKAFSDAIAVRQSKDQTLKADLLEVISAKVSDVQWTEPRNLKNVHSDENVSANDNSANDNKDADVGKLDIWIAFETKQIITLFDSEHRVISGSPNKEQNINERWCFSMLLRSDGEEVSGWKLSRTIQQDD